MADYTQIIDLTDDKLTTLHKNLHGDIEDSAVVEAHHLVTTEMARRGLDHGHIDDAWAFAQVEVDRVESIDLENVTTELSDELAVEVAKTIGISGDVKVVLGVNGYEMQIEKSQEEIDDLEFDVLAGDVEKTIRRRNGKYTVFSADGSREFGTYDSKKEAEERLAQIERFKEINKADGYTPPAAVREAAQRALDWISEGKAGQGFTSVGRGRARQLASGDSVGVDTLKRMRSFLARHIVDKKAEGFSRGEKGYPTPGRVAWDAWGGDAGRAWVESILDKLEKSENPEMYDPEESLNDRQAILYATLENIVSEFGAFNEGIGADGAHYMSEENNPFASKGMNCANCVFFEGGGGCEILNIEVQPMGVCKFWIIPEKNLQTDMEKHETHDQLSHGSWAGEGSSSIASRIKNNLSRYQIQESYGQNYDEGKKAKEQAPRTGKQSYNNYKTQRDKWLKEIGEFPDRSIQAENYAGLLAEAQGFMDGFDNKRPIVSIRRFTLSSPFQYEPSGVFKHGTHDQSDHGSWARGGVTSGLTQSVLDRVKANGGLSVNMVDGSEPKSGYMVASPVKKAPVVDANDFYDPIKGRKILGDFVKANKSTLGSGKKYLGLWHNKEDGKVYLDVSENIQDRGKATRLGRERNQISIWDVANFAEIETGGTGVTKEGRNKDGRNTIEYIRDDRRTNRQLGGQRLQQVGEVEKHGTHDQQSHGSWAGTRDGLPKLTENKSGKGTAEANAQAKQLRDKVSKLEPEITNMVTNIADAVGGKMEGLEFRLKTEESLARKIDADAKDFGGDRAKAAEKVSDAIRYTMVVDSNNYTDAVQTTLDALTSEGLQPSRVKNFWQKGDDYQGINAKIKHPNGFEFEFQFHTPQSLSMKERVHPLYEQRRTSTEPKQQYKLYKRTVRLVNRLAAPVGVLAVGELATNPLILGGKQVLFKAYSKFFSRYKNV